MIVLTTHLWVHWSDIALDATVRAREARDDQKLATDTSEASTFIAVETRATLVAVAASAHALEAFANQISECLPEPLRKVPQRPAARRIRRTLATAFVIDESLWGQQLRTLFTLRNESLHYREVPGEPQSHPARADLRTSKVDADYNADEATRSGSVLVGLPSDCWRGLRPGAEFEPTVRYCGQLAASLKLLRERWAEIEGVG